jgi:hypothetical protein
MNRTSHPKDAPLAPSTTRPKLLTPKQLCDLYPIKRRTLKYWLQHSAVRHISRDGKPETIPGNGLAPAIVRKGRIVLIDEVLFLAWLYGDKPSR